MAFYIFDFDGTIACVKHRRPLLVKRQWDAFFEACDQDPAIPDVIAILKDLLAAGHRVEIWSGRSETVEQKSRDWLGRQDLPPSILKRMRPEGDYTPDEKLKRAWLHEEQALGNTPLAIFDDRQKVVDMWRAEGMNCYQVNAGDFDSPTRVNPNYIYTDGGVPLLTLLIGPPGAGKSTLAREKFDPQTVVSADLVRKYLTGSPKDQTRNNDVWTAVHLLVQTRLAVGLPTVVDATNVKNADRKKLVALMDPKHRCAYLLVQRSYGEIALTAGDRLDVMRYSRDGQQQNMIQRYEQTMKSNLKDILKGDGLPNVDVYASWDEYAAALGQKAAAFFSPEAVAARAALANEVA